MSSYTSSSNQAAFSSQNVDGKVQKNDPVYKIDIILNQLKELSAIGDSEENFYNSFQNKLSHYDVISINPSENK